MKNVYKPELIKWPTFMNFKDTFNTKKKKKKESLDMKHGIWLHFYNSFNQNYTKK